MRITRVLVLFGVLAGALPWPRRRRRRRCSSCTRARTRWPSSTRRAARWWAASRPGRTPTSWPSPTTASSRSPAITPAPGRAGGNTPLRHRHRGPQGAAPGRSEPAQPPHGLWFADGKLYFTAEGSMAIARYDPASNKVDWLLGPRPGPDPHDPGRQGPEDDLHVERELEHDQHHRAQGSPRVGRADRAASPAVPAALRAAGWPSAGGPDGPPPGGRWTAARWTGWPAARAGPGGPSARVDRGGGPGWRQTLVPVGRGPEGFDLSPDGKELWTAHMGDGRISVIDVASKKVVQTIDAGARAPNRLKFTPGRQAGAGLRDRRRRPDRPGHRDAVRDEAGAARPRRQRHPDPARRRVAPTSPSPGATPSRSSTSTTLTEVGRFKTGSGPDGMAWLPSKRN